MRCPVDLESGLSSGADWIPLAQELKHLSGYLSIQKARYRDILNYRIDVPQELGEVYVLKLLLQPLVENAIYHGIKDRRGGGLITVTGREESGFLCFRVQDTGRGMTPEQLRDVCARMRRGYLYEEARRLDCNKIALGHHFDDVIETILMAMLYGGQMQSMPPKLYSTNHPGMQLIRPLYYVHEEDIIRWKERYGLRFLRCACRFTEKSEEKEDNSKRLEIKRLIASLKKTNPNADINIFRSAYNVHVDTLIEYDSQGVRYDFLSRYKPKS